MLIIRLTRSTKGSTALESKPHNPVDFKSVCPCTEGEMGPWWTMVPAGEG